MGWELLGTPPPPRWPSGQNLQLPTEGDKVGEGDGVEQKVHGSHRGPGGPGGPGGASAIRLTQPRPMMPRVTPACGALNGPACADRRLTEAGPSPVPGGWRCPQKP